ncbi:MAG: bifunctional folylpolyglutamate synthase/dihydrofolate synthase [Magnetococcales bacterium]|nr:bifunctional folylpolyglutamate synthase/dihydrofolate synthase [Magnetococcales bacterium]
MNDAALTRLLQQAQRNIQTEPLLGLERMRQLLSALGNPQQQGHFIHVAGTNGKGSTIAFLRTMLLQAGHCVGSYTSPHLHCFNERIVVNDQSITDEQLQALLQQVLAIPSEATFFELTTAIAFCHFAALPSLQLTLLETGLGGRLDATNVVTPCLCILTALDLDHGDYLGTTLSQVAREKAGILKVGVPAVADPGSAIATTVIRQRARELSTPLWLRGEQFDYIIHRDGTWHYQDQQGTLSLPAPGLIGDHQYQNAALAIAALRLLQWPIETEAINRGIAQTRWPGRMERYEAPVTVWLDGAHNPHAIQALLQTLASLPGSPTYLIFSALKDKDVAAMACLLASVVDRVWTVSVTTEPESRCLSSQQLATLWQPYHTAATPCSSATEALEQALSACPSHGRVVVTGSLYLVAAVRSYLLSRTQP